MNSENISSELQEIKSLLAQQTEKPMCFEEAVKYLDISKSYLYKLTCKNAIPYYKPNGKKIYFSKSDLDNWILRNRVISQEEIENKANAHINKT